MHITRVGAIAMHDFLVRYREGGDDVFNAYNTEHRGHPLAGFGIFDLTGFPQIEALERRYLPADRMDRYDRSIGVYDPRTGQAGAGKKAA
jgi:hypothetical protein